jgi:hypothetical protein
MNLHEIYTANSALSDLIESAETISSDGKEYFNCLVRSSNRLRAENAIIEKEKDALSARVTVRRTALSGKRKAIGDGSLLTTAKNFRGVRDAERKTKESRAKKPKVDKRKKQQARDPFSEELSTDSEAVEDLEVVVLDSIEVLV